MFIHVHVLETLYNISNLYGFRSQILICHVLLAYVMVGTSQTRLVLVQTTA